MDIPIIAAHLDKHNKKSLSSKVPAILRDNTYFANVPFGPKKIKYALDFFPNSYEKHRGKVGSIYYPNIEELVS
ncbi:MAG: hypothetical protein GY927_10020 [bacterium]|nr:hypothetical protein [bacterium]